MAHFGGDAGVLGRTVIVDDEPHTIVGVTTGWSLAWLLGRGMESLLFNVAAADGWSFVIAGAAAVAISVVATWIPARAALRASPLDSLREQ